MSVTTYYGRLSQQQFDAMRTSPNGLAQFVDGTLPETQVLYLDKAAPVISWLVSPLKRHEQLHFAAVLEAEDIETFEPPDFGPEPEMDDLLLLIEGRGTKVEELDVGMGPACVFTPTEVQKYLPLLLEIDEQALRSQMDFAALDAAALSVDYWAEEGEENFAQYVLPLFKQLQEFVRTANSSGEHVLVWYN